MVLRPDSGDPVEAVIKGLVAGEKAFGSRTNAKGFKVLNNCSVIQGDGIDPKIICAILDKVLEAGYSAACVAFGMGGGLLQKVNRDTLSFATKLSYIQYADGTARDTMKYPKTDPLKCSIPGRVAVRMVDDIPTVFAGTAQDVGSADNLLKVVWNCGPVDNAFAQDFDSMRSQVHVGWNKLPKKHKPWSDELVAKVHNWPIQNADRIASPAQQ
jgi:nicotinamide phosphoribosyltransferase